MNSKKILDNRGHFERLYCENELKSLNLDISLVQINTSYNDLMGTLRGMHLQSGTGSETKIVRCISGSIWDVVVDLRRSSNTFGKWYGINLNNRNQSMIMVPEGCAHGYMTLENRCEIMYFVSNFYDKSKEITLNWCDPEVGIKWPMEPKILSNKDKKGISLEDASKIVNKKRINS